MHSNRVNLLRGLHMHTPQLSDKCLSNFTPSFVISLITPSLLPLSLSRGACMLIVLIDIVLPWRGEDIEDTGGSLRNNA